MKTCSRCPTVLENQNTKTGSYCPPCRNEYLKNYNRENPEVRRSADRNTRGRIRQRIIEEKSKPCLDCGKSYPWYVMDFDHVRGDKVIVLSEAAHKHLSISRLEDEMAKCDVVCANCHRERTFQRVVRLMDKPSRYERDIIGSSPIRPSILYRRCMEETKKIPDELIDPPTAEDLERAARGEHFKLVPVKK